MPWTARSLCAEPDTGIITPEGVFILLSIIGIKPYPVRVLQSVSTRCVCETPKFKMIIIFKNVRQARFILYPPYLRQCIAIFAVADEWLLLDIG